MATTPETALDQAIWSNGWLTGLAHLPSANQGRRPAGAHVDLIVVHSISLPPASYGGDGIERLFTNRLDWRAHPYFEGLRGLRVSSHFVIRRDGQVIQFVSCDRRAWHAGRSAYRGRSDCNNDSVGVELEGLEGQTFEAHQYDSLVRLCRRLAERYPICHVAGHEHIAPGRKFDPGAGFDWSHLRNSLAWPDNWFPTPSSAAPCAQC